MFCWHRFNVCDVGPALNQHWLSVTCRLDRGHYPAKTKRWTNVVGPVSATLVQHLTNIGRIRCLLRANRSRDDIFLIRGLPSHSIPTVWWINTIEHWAATRPRDGDVGFTKQTRYARLMLVQYWRIIACVYSMVCTGVQPDLYQRRCKSLFFQVLKRRLILSELLCLWCQEKVLSADDNAGEKKTKWKRILGA